MNAVESVYVLPEIGRYLSFEIYVKQATASSWPRVSSKEKVHAVVCYAAPPNCRMRVSKTSSKSEVKCYIVVTHLKTFSNVVIVGGSLLLLSLRT